MSLFLPLVAAAHVGAEHAQAGFFQGFLHPLTGVDHLLAMVAVGLWSSRTAPRADWRLYAVAPATFAGLLVLGALLVGQPVSLPAIEPMIAASVLVFGLLIALRLTWPTAAGAALVGVFALFHGAAHGQELEGGAALLGMALATLLLHCAGIAAGLVLRRASVWWTRAIGLGLVAAGGGLLLA